MFSNALEGMKNEIKCSWIHNVYTVLQMYLQFDAWNIWREKKCMWDKKRVKIEMEEKYVILGLLNAKW